MMPYTMVDEVTGNQFEFDDKFPMSKAREVVISQRASAPPREAPLDRLGRVGRETFPMFGMMTGSAAGGAKGAAVGGAVAGPPGAILGGTLGALGGGIAGGAGGSAIKQGLDYYAGVPVTPESALQNVGADTKAAAYSELIPPLAFAGGRYALESPQAQYAVGKMAEWIPTGKALLNYYSSKTYRKMLEARSKVFGELVGKDLPEGQNISEIGPVTKRALTAEAKAAYSTAKEGLVDEVIPVPNFRQRLGLALQDPKILRDQKATDWVNRQLELSKTGSMTGPEIDAAQSKINTMLYGKSPDTAESVWLSGLYADLRAADVQAGRAGPDAIAEAYKQARGSYRNKMAFDSVYSVFRRATRVEADLTETFNPGIARVELDRQRDNILRQFGKQEGQAVIDTLDDFLRSFGSAVKDMKAHPPVSTAEMIGFGGGSAAVAGYIPGGKEWLPVPYGLSLWAAHSVASPKGYFRLAKAGKLPPTSPALKLGAKIGVFKAAEQDASEAPPGALPWRK